MNVSIVKFNQAMTENFNDLSPKIHIGGHIKLFYKEIIMITADTNYSQVHLSNGKTICSSTNIGKLETRLTDFQNFKRVHRSYLINTDYLEAINGNSAILKNGLTCLVSRRKREVLETFYSQP